ncbi:MAG: cobalt-precorrin-5B (C(1))-methyltransferase CbiD [bacterium]|nr:cobalt-precorrin-5B (C(1))-methyltransferase CbiD [bacterium]
MRSGFTTGTCAAAAAGAAALACLLGEFPTVYCVLTPKGTTARLEIHEKEIGPGYAVCGVYKDSGDDPDVTNGAWVGAAVYRKSGVTKKPVNGTQDTECVKRGMSAEFDKKRQQVLEHGYWHRTENGAWIGIAGGVGIGTVTKRGLSCPPGHAAINPVPREMIFKEVQKSLEMCGCDQHGEEIVVEVRIPQGVELAEKTFNPKLGIVGGISVLGTSGVVEPMSEDALVASIQLELHIKAVEGRKFLVLTPGNYGEQFIRDEFGFSLEEAVKCSNFIGTSVKLAQKEGFLGILLVGHLGKLIKVSLGVMNTHSKYGDRRIEGFLSAMQACGITAENGFEDVLEKISGSNTSEEAVEALQNTGLLEPVMREIVRRIQMHLMESLKEEKEKTAPEASEKRPEAENKQVIQIEVVTFSSVLGLVGRTEGAMQMAEKIRVQEEK